MPDQDERPATKHDLDQLEARLVENMRDMQTEVLRAFLTLEDAHAPLCG